MIYYIIYIVIYYIIYIVIKAAERLNINYSSAKDIFRLYKKTGRIDKYLHKKKRILYDSEDILKNRYNQDKNLNYF